MAVTNLSEKVQKNPAALLAILLVAHMIVLSLNRTPDRPGLDPGRRYLQVWLMTALMPFQWATAKVASGIGSTWNRYVSLKDARIENEQLRTERYALEAKLLELEEKQRLAEQLHEFGEWQANAKESVTLARVISRDANQWFGSVVIDKGTIAGVQRNQPVITRDGLVGRTISVGPLASRVLLLTDERHGAGAIVGQLADSRLLGVVKGKSDARCEIKFVESPEEIQTGELVLTSGQDGVYPRGLVIGRIRSAAGGTAGSSILEVEPAASLGKLDLVAVLGIKPDQFRGRVDDLVDAERKEDREKQDRAPMRNRR